MGRDIGLDGEDLKAAIRGMSWSPKEEAPSGSKRKGGPRTTGTERNESSSKDLKDVEAARKHREVLDDALVLIEERHQHGFDNRANKCAKEVKKIGKKGNPTTAETRLRISIRVPGKMAIDRSDWRYHIHAVRDMNDSKDAKAIMTAAKRALKCVDSNDCGLEAVGTSIKKALKNYEDTATIGSQGTNKLESKGDSLKAELLKLLDEDESREKPTSIAQVVHAGSSRNNSSGSSKNRY